MAKPVAPTPTLRGKDAFNFLMEMCNETINPSPGRVEMLKKIREKDLPLLF